MNLPAGLRDTILFIGGALLMSYEVLAVSEPRLVVLGLAATMLGLPGSLGMDRVLKQGPKPEPTRHNEGPS